MPTYDFMCPAEHIMEVRCSISEKKDSYPCAECGEATRQVILEAPAIASHIVLDYPGSKKHKAGYQHSHGDRKGTKIQVGYGGKITPSETPKATSDAIWKNPLA